MGKLFIIILVPFSFIICSSVIAQNATTYQRIIVIMIDGFGEKYYRAASLPFLNEMEKNGIYKVVPSLMPAVTNVNNMAIATGVAPEINGITGNVYYDEKKQQEVYIEDPSILLAPSVIHNPFGKSYTLCRVRIRPAAVTVVCGHF